MDALRGLALLVMAATHLGGPVARFTWQPFGFVSMAEVFFFVSGLVCGRSCAQRLLGQASEPWGVGRRVRRIYRAHLLSVACAAAGVTVLVAVSPASAPAWEAGWPLLSHSPARALAMGAMFLSVPPPFDVLPLYCAFLLSVPFVVRACASGRVRPVLVVSLAAWLLSQVTLGRLLHWAVRLVPDGRAPGFDPLGWQLVFVAGIVVSWLALTGRADRLVLRGRWLALAAALAVLFLAARYVAPQTGLLAQVLVGRPSVGPLRLLNFAVLALLVVSQRERIARVLPSVLRTVGRQPLAVFGTHAVLLVLLVPLRPAINARGAAAEIALTLAFCGMLVLIAWVRERRRADPLRHPVLA